MTSKTPEQQLIKEARTLANRINLARFEGEMPTVEDTVRLVEVTDLLNDLRKQPPVFSEYPRSEGT
tara:strand:+ start:783 stop:980 length:198 start_codon:yes stop_codon:yes gene_type:complete